MLDVYIKTHVAIRFAGRKGKWIVPKQYDKNPTKSAGGNIIKRVRQANEHADMFFNLLSNLEKIDEEENPFDTDYYSIELGKEEVIRQMRQANEYADELLNSLSGLETTSAEKEDHPFGPGDYRIEPTKNHRYETDCSVCGATNSVWYTETPDTGPLLKCESCGSLWGETGILSLPEKFDDDEKEENPFDTFSLDRA